MKHMIRNNRGFLVALVGLALFRTAIADWNPIPSGSMRPNLLEGDVVFVNRLAYNLKLPLTDIILARIGEPQHGDIVTFSSPRDGTRLIKRIVGLPGDTIEMRDEHLLVNGVAAEYTDAEVRLERSENGIQNEALVVTEAIGEGRRKVQWIEGRMALNSFGPQTIPADRYLVLGDNRDNSADSRYIGLVPRSLLIGRASNILVSADILGNWLPRLERFGLALK